MHLQHHICNLDLNKTCPLLMAHVMMETISYYNANGSNLYAIMLDASKAFNRVNYCKLSRVLLKRQVSALVLRLLLYMYTKQKLQARWGCSILQSVQDAVHLGHRVSTINKGSLGTDGKILERV